MKSCLDYLWEETAPLIKELLKSEETCNALDINKQIYNAIDCCIKEIKSNTEICEIKHLEIFQSCFKANNNSSLHIIKNAELAIKEVDKCKLCYLCTKCSENAYNSIIKNNIEINTIPNNLDDYFSSRSQIAFYQPFFSRKKFFSNNINSFLCLKGFSSSTPMFRTAVFNGHCFGGGFYLNIAGVGIVIDPGVDFVNLMHHYGISITDIDVIIITHNHTDHYADAPLISSINYDLNLFYSDTQIMHKLFGMEKRFSNHKIKWILDSSTKKMLGDTINCTEDSKDLEDFIENPQKITDSECKIILSSIRAKHDNNIPCYGIKIQSQEDNCSFSLGYTSDTKYLEEYSIFYDNLDVLVFNISDIYRNDVLYYEPKHSHLGYSGSLKLINSICKKPKLAIASEFCCVNGDFRIQLISKLINESRIDGFSTTIIPSSIGLKIKFPDMSFQCTSCKNYVPIEQLHVIKSIQDYGELQYICDKCTIH